MKDLAHTFPPPPPSSPPLWSVIGRERKKNKTMMGLRWSRSLSSMSVAFPRPPSLRDQTLHYGLGGAYFKKKIVFIVEMP